MCFGVRVGVVQEQSTEGRSNACLAAVTLRVNRFMPSKLMQHKTLLTTRRDYQHSEFDAFLDCHIRLLLPAIDAM
eukprot:4908613-Amphidinium_carterae.1